MAQNNRIESLVIQLLSSNSAFKHLTKLKESNIVSTNNLVYLYNQSEAHESTEFINSKTYPTKHWLKPILGPQKGLFISETIGDGNCLLHSILFATSKTYRESLHKKRVLIADLFREWLCQHVDELVSFKERYLTSLLFMGKDEEFIQLCDKKSMFGSGFRVYLSVNFGIIICQYFGFNYLPFYLLNNNLSLKDKNGTIIYENIIGEIPFDSSLPTIIIRFTGGHFETIIANPRLLIEKKDFKSPIYPTRKYDVYQLTSDVAYTFYPDQIQELLKMYGAYNKIHPFTSPYRNVEVLEEIHNVPASSVAAVAAPISSNNKRNTSRKIPLEPIYRNFFKKEGEQLGISTPLHKMSFMRALKRRSETRKAAKTNNTEKQPNNSMKAKLAAFNAFKKTYKSSKNNQAVTAPPAAAPSKIENLRARLEAAKLKKAMNKTKKAAKKTDDELINSFFRNNPKTRSITKNTFKKALNDRVPGNHTSNNTMKDIFLNWDWYLQDQQGL